MNIETDAKRIASELTFAEAKLWTHALSMMETPGDVIAASRTMAFYIELGLAERLD